MITLYEPDIEIVLRINNDEVQHTESHRTDRLRERLIAMQFATKGREVKA